MENVTWRSPFLSLSLFCLLLIVVCNALFWPAQSAIPSDGTGFSTLHYALHCQSETLISAPRWHAAYGAESPPCRGMQRCRTCQAPCLRLRE